MTIPKPIATTMVEWPSEKKYPTLSGRVLRDSLSIVHELAGGVVDGGDVVGVKGVARPSV